MIAKLIAFAPDRAGAIERLTSALEQTVVAGVKTNAAFLHGLLSHSAFRAGEIDTGFIGRELGRLTSKGTDAAAVAYGVVSLIRQRQRELEAQRRRISNRALFTLGGSRCIPAGRAASPFARRRGGGPKNLRRGPVERRTVRASLLPGEPGPIQCNAINAKAIEDGQRVFVLHNLRQTEVAWPVYDVSAADESDGTGNVRAPINGRVVKVFVEEGTLLDKGQRIAVIEAMKMEHVLVAPIRGRIAKLTASEGQQVTEGTVLATLVEE